MVPKDKTYGITINQYMSTGREVMMVEHFLLENSDLNDLSGLAGYSIVLDMEDIVMRYIGPRVAELQTNIQENDRDGRRDQFLSEVGLEARLEKKHALLTGVKS